MVAALSQLAPNLESTRYLKFASDPRDHDRGLYASFRKYSKTVWSNYSIDLSNAVFKILLYN